MATRPGRGSPVRYFDTTASTDNVSRLLDAARLVPERFRGSDRFLDIVSWNIRWFDASDPKRVTAITSVLEALNADALVLTEIAADGALDAVVSGLGNRGAGYYSAFYGTTGSQQRVVLVWDRDWLRTKEDPQELFGNEHLTVPSETGTKPSNVFPRLPVWAYFEALTPTPGDEGFTFELAGVHLKAQGPAPKGHEGEKPRWGIPQRTAAAERLATWLGTGTDHADNDILIIGDWNAAPTLPEWDSLRTLEGQGELEFAAINPATEVSHLARLNASGPAGTRLDLHLITDTASANAVPDNKGVVITWRPFDHLSTLPGKQRQDLFKRLTKTFSDHLPVLSRFYLTPA